MEMASKPCLSSVHKYLLVTTWQCCERGRKRDSFIFAYRAFQLLEDGSNSIGSHRMTVAKSLNGCAYHICVRLSIDIPILLLSTFPKCSL